MFLIEQKEVSSQTLDMKAVALRWSKLTDSQKAKYKEKSMQDKEIVQVKKKERPVKSRKRKFEEGFMNEEMKKKCKKQERYRVKSQET